MLLPTPQAADDHHRPRRTGRSARRRSLSLSAQPLNAPKYESRKCQLRLLSASRTPPTTPRETASPTIGPPFKPRSTRLKRPAEPRFSFRSEPTSFLATAGILTRF